MSQQDTWDALVALLKKEVVPALGCTDPVAIALASAKAREALGREPERIDLFLSRNVLKNAMAVGIPGADSPGVALAAALGAFGGDPALGLRVLQSLSAEGAERAKRFATSGAVSVALKDTPESLYIEAVASACGRVARVVAQGDYERVVLVEVDGKPVFELERARSSGGPEPAAGSAPTTGLSMRSAFDFAVGAPIAELRFLLDAARMNAELAAEGLAGHYGLGVGRAMKESRSRTDSAIIDTAAAVDARMAGCRLPAMTNSGSGNQGITATLPVAAEAEALGASEEALARALVLSHLVSIHIRQHFDRLSPMCGTIPAATGAACGIVLLRGGGYAQLVAVVANMAGDLPGMVCDGAKSSCALKASSAVQAAMQAAMLAMGGVRVSGLEGIVEDDVEKIIDNLGRLGSDGMRQADAMILDMMLAK